MSNRVCICNRCKNPLAEEDAEYFGIYKICPKCKKEMDEIKDTHKKRFEKNRPTYTTDCYVCEGRGRVHGPDRSIKCPSCDGKGKKKLQQSFADALKWGQTELPSTYLGKFYE